MNISKSQSCEIPYFKSFTWYFQSPNHVISLQIAISHELASKSIMWNSKSRFSHMNHPSRMSCDSLKTVRVTWITLLKHHVNPQKKSKSHEPPSQNIMWFLQNKRNHMFTLIKTSCEPHQTSLVTWSPNPKVMWINKVVELSHNFSRPPSP